MATYRLYCLDGLSKVVSAEWIEAEDDGRAVELAKDMTDAMKCELWQGDRLIARLDRKERNASAGAASR